jgi:hypothetical protein
MEKIMENQWVGFDDFDLACLAHDYGFGDVCEFAQILPVKLANRNAVESALSQHEFEMAFGE